MNGNGSETLQISTETPDKRIDWERNHVKIQAAWAELLAELKRTPTQTEIAEKCGLSRVTVNQHCRQSALCEFTEQFKARTAEVLEGLTLRAERGYAAEVRLWLSVIHEFRDEIGIRHSGSVEVTSGAKDKILSGVDGLASRIVQAGSIPSN